MDMDCVVEVGGLFDKYTPGELSVVVDVRSPK